MNLKKTTLVAACLFLLLISAKSTFAEIATVRDWIGLFDTTQTGNSKSNTVPTNDLPDQRSWKYTSSCEQDPGTTPSLFNLSGCNFSLRPTPPDGNYEFRLYANDQESADALIAKSAPFSFAQNPNPEYIPTKGKLYSFTGNLTLNGNITPVDVPGVIFVSKTNETDGNLNINTNLTNTNDKTGLLFVVEGNVLIDKSVTRIDAVIISSGAIYTATDKSATPPTTTCDTSLVNVANNLTINGSLISLDPGAIIFCRTLTTNVQAAEKIVHQPKYLVILRDLFADTLLKWSEVSAGGSAVSTICSDYDNKPPGCVNAGCRYSYQNGECR